MNKNSCLGIHYSRTSITAVLVKKKDHQWQCAENLTLPVQPGPDPIQDQTPEEIRARADAAVTELVARLTE